jgi:hypothetical protein
VSKKWAVNRGLKALSTAQRACIALSISNESEIILPEAKSALTLLVRGMSCYGD